MARRGQGNFKLAANFGYSSRGSADPRESLRKRRILKLALTAHKVSCHPGSAFLLLGFGTIFLSPASHFQTHPETPPHSPCRAEPPIHTQDKLFSYHLSHRSSLPPPRKVSVPSFYFSEAPSGPIFCLRIPMVVVSRKMIFSSFSLSSSMQITFSCHPGRFFFMYTGV